MNSEYNVQILLHLGHQATAGAACLDFFSLIFLAHGSRWVVNFFLPRQGGFQPGVRNESTLDNSRGSLDGDVPRFLLLRIALSFSLDLVPVLHEVVPVSYGPSSADGFAPKYQSQGRPRVSHLFRPHSFLLVSFAEALSNRRHP